MTRSLQQIEARRRQVEKLLQTADRATEKERDALTREYTQLLEASVKLLTQENQALKQNVKRITEDRDYWEIDAKAWFKKYTDRIKG